MQAAQGRLWIGAGPRSRTHPIRFRQCQMATRPIGQRIRQLLTVVRLHRVSGANQAGKTGPARPAQQGRQGLVQHVAGVFIKQPLPHQVTVWCPGLGFAELVGPGIASRPGSGLWRGLQTCVLLRRKVLQRGLIRTQAVQRQQTGAALVGVCVPVKRAERGTGIKKSPQNRVGG